MKLKELFRVSTGSSPSSLDDSLPQSEQLGLALLHISESFCEIGLWVLKAVRTVAQQVIRRGIQSVSKEQVPNVDHLASPRSAAALQQRNEMLDVFLEDLGIDDAIPGEHGPDELSRARPLLSIRGEDAVPQELFPFLMERLALAKVRKLAGQHGLDVGWVRCQDNPVRDAGVQVCSLRVVDLVGATGCFDRIVPEFHDLESFIGFV